MDFRSNKTKLTAALVLAAGAGLAAIGNQILNPSSSATNPDPSIGTVIFNAGSPTPNSVPFEQLPPGFKNYAIENECITIVQGSNERTYVTPGSPTNRELLTARAHETCILGGEGAEIAYAGPDKDSFNLRGWIRSTDGVLLTGPSNANDTVSYQNATSSVKVDFNNSANNLGEYAAGDTYKAGVGRVFLSPSSDTFIPGSSNIFVDGMTGTDTVVFPQERSRYTLTQSGTNIIVSGPDVAGQNITVTTNRIERFVFPDRILTLGSDGLIANAGVTDTDQVLTDGADTAHVIAGKTRVFAGLGNDRIIAPVGITCPNGKIQVHGESSKDTTTGQITWRSGGYNTADFGLQPDLFVWHPTDESKVEGSLAKCFSLNSIQRIFGPSRERSIFYAGPPDRPMRYAAGNGVDAAGVPFDDVAIFTGNYADYDITNSGAMTIVTPRPGTSTGNSQTILERVERLVFNDGYVHKGEPFRPHILSFKIDTSFMPKNALGATVYYGKRLADIIDGKVNVETGAATPDGSSALRNYQYVINQRLNTVVTPGFVGDNRQGVAEPGSMLGEGTRYRTYSREEMAGTAIFSRTLGTFDQSNTFQAEHYTRSDRYGVLIMWIMPVDKGPSFGGIDSRLAPYHLRAGDIPFGRGHLTETPYIGSVTNSTRAEIEARMRAGHAAGCWMQSARPTALQAHIDSVDYGTLGNLYAGQQVNRFLNDCNQFALIIR